MLRLANTRERIAGVEDKGGSKSVRFFVKGKPDGSLSLRRR